MIVEKLSLQFEKVEVINQLSVHCSTPHTQHDTLFVFDQVPHTLEFSIVGKTDKDTRVDPNSGNIIKDASVAVVSMYVDLIKIDVLSLRDIMWFEPLYDRCQLEYAHENGINLREKIHDETEFYFNGKLCFDFSTFYQTYNKNLMNGLTKYNSWVLHSNLGYVTENDFTELQQIHKTLCDTKKF